MENRILVKPHKTLSKLVLHGNLAFTILAPSGIHKPLGELLPNLLTLELAASVAFEPIYVDRLPPTLTELSVTAGDLGRLPISVINKLPRTLASLTLRSIPFECNEEPLDSISFPPALTSFITRARFPFGLIKYMPRTLRTLRFWSFADDDFRVLKVSDLPPSLTSLTLPSPRTFMDYYYLLLDLPLTLLPLNTLVLPNKDFKLITDANNLESSVTTLDGILPPTLTTFYGVKELHGATNWLNTTPRLKECELDDSVFRTSTPSSLPPSDSSALRSIHVIDTVIPMTLTKLIASVSDHPNWLRAIPKLTHLECLKLQDESLLPSDGFWNLMKTRLTRLRVRLTTFESLDDLQHGWTRLKSLKLSCLEVAPGSKISTELQDYSADLGSERKIFQFPSTLTYLNIAVDSIVSFMIWSLSNLTQLKRLNFKLRSEGPQAFLVDALSSLPPSVTNLSMLLCCEVTVPILRALPPKLLILKSECNEKYERNELVGEKHAKAMPKSLSALDMPWAKTDRATDWSFGPHLPKLIYCSRHIGTSKAYLELKRQEYYARHLAEPDIGSSYWCLERELKRHPYESDRSMK